MTTATAHMMDGDSMIFRRVKNLEIFAHKSMARLRDMDNRSVSADISAQERIASLEERIASLEERIASLEERIDNITQRGALDTESLPDFGQIITEWIYGVEPT